MPSISVLVLFALLSAALAAPEWRKVVTTGDYIPRGEAAFAQCGPKVLCLLGGRGAGTVNVLDTESLTWTTAAKPPLEIHHVQAVFGPDQCVWLAGAWTGGYPNERNVDQIWRYCRAQNVWLDGPSIPRPRGAGGTVIHSGKLYLISGNDGGHNTNAKLVPWFDSFDIATGTWAQLPDVPHPRDHFHATVVDNKLYVVGGRDSSASDFFNAVTPEVDVYDFATNTWSSLPDFPRPRGGTSTVRYDQTVYVLAGEGEGRAWSEVDVLQGSTFVPGDNMPEPRHGTGVVSCSGAMWIAGGAIQLGGGSNAKDTYAYFDGNLPPVCDDITITQSPPATSNAPPASSPSASAMLPDASISPTKTPSPPTESTPVPSLTPPVPTSAFASPSASTSMSTAVSGSPVIGPTLPVTPSASQTVVINPSQITSISPTFSSNPLASIAPSSSFSDPEASPDDSDLEPSPDAVASPTPDCFPSRATVQLEDGSVKTMGELQIGDRVKVAHPNTYSEVFFFSHNHPTARGSGIELETSENDISLTLSPGHLLYVNGELQAAMDVHVGDTVQVSVKDETKRTATVTSTRRVTSTGLHNPHTLHGDIVVDGVVASTFTRAVHPVTARALLLPFRLAYRMVGPHRSVDIANQAVLRMLDRMYWSN